MRVQNNIRSHLNYQLSKNQGILQKSGAPNRDLRKQYSAAQEFGCDTEILLVYKKFKIVIAHFGSACYRRGVCAAKTSILGRGWIAAIRFADRRSLCCI